VLLKGKTEKKAPVPLVPGDGSEPRDIASYRRRRLPCASPGNRTKMACQELFSRQASPSIPKSSGPGSRRQKQPDCRQHFLNRLPDPHGQRSFLPSFSVSSLCPWTTRRPRFTFVSDGKPLRRLLIVSKKTTGVRGLAGP